MAVLAVGYIGGTDEGYSEYYLESRGRLGGQGQVQLRTDSDYDVDRADGELDARASWWTAAVMRPHVEAVAGAGGYGSGAGGSRSLAPLDRQEVQAIICAPHLPWPCEWAWAVVDCESSFRADAWATEIYEGQRYWFHGWWQIVSTSPEPGLLADPVYNTERAAWKYVNEGTGAWPNCP